MAENSRPNPVTIVLNNNNSQAISSSNMTGLISITSASILNDFSFKSTSLTTSSSNSEPKVIYTLSSLGKTTSQIGVDRTKTTSPSFVSIQSLKSHPNVITTMLDTGNLTQGNNKTIFSSGTHTKAFPQSSVRIIAPHSTTQGTIQATLKRNNPDSENPLITKVVIANPSKSNEPLSLLADGSIIKTSPGGQKHIFLSPTKTLQFTDSVHSSQHTSPIVVKSLQPGGPKKIFLKPNSSIFGVNKLSPDKRMELTTGGLNAPKLHCIKLVTTPTKCNSDGNNTTTTMIGKLKPMSEIGLSRTEPTVVSLQKQQFKSTQRILFPAPPSSTAGQQQTITTVGLSPQTSTTLQNYVMVPAQYLQSNQVSQDQQLKTLPALQPQIMLQSESPQLGPMMTASGKKIVNIQPKYVPPPVEPVNAQPISLNGSSETNNNDSRPRKPCNCTKSQCLKLYCDCFANGEFCNMCNCTNCYNNLEHEEDRQKAIKACLDRNPLAFHPKIGKGKSKNGDHERRHTKGCNCKRSGCLKNYCECYEAKILCTNLCKCNGCKNFEDSTERKSLMQLADAAEVRVQQQAAAKCKLPTHVPFRSAINSSSGERPPFALITEEVIEAATQCLMAQADEGTKLHLPDFAIKRIILEEFGRCLLQIIDCSNKTKNI